MADINLGSTIRELRKQRGITQETLAAALSVTAQAVSKWESGVSFPEMTMIPLIAGYFEVSLDVLFDFDLRKIAGMVQSRIQLYSEIPDQIDFLNAVPEYDVAMYTHKKSKSTAESSLQILKETIPLLAELESFDNDSLFAALSAYASEKGFKVNTVMWPLRTAVSGRQATPSGATGIMDVLGKDESLRRLRMGLEKIEQAAE